MGARFHLLDNDIFAARIPGNAPTDTDRKTFKSPKLKKGMLEREIYPQGAVIQSVLKAANCKKLRLLDTASHKTMDGDRGRRGTSNDAGICRNTPHATRYATDLDYKRRIKSKINKEQLEKRIPGARSWFWMDVPVEVKGTGSRGICRQARLSLLTTACAVSRLGLKNESPLATYGVDMYLTMPKRVS